MLKQIFLLGLVTASLAACGGGETAQPQNKQNNIYLASSVKTASSPTILSDTMAKHTIKRVGNVVEITHKITFLRTTVAADARVQFTDASMAFDTEGNAGKIYRLYQAAFKRTPDPNGLGFWIGVMDGGASLAEIATGFVKSAEYQSIYGYSPTHAAVISRFYRNVLNREGEAGGQTYWNNMLDNRQASVAEVLAGFAESPENKANLSSKISNGIVYRKPSVSYVPVADAGASQEVNSTGKLITLDGSASFGAPNQTLSYSWTITKRPDGSVAQISVPSLARPTFIADKVGSYTISLTVSDGSAKNSVASTTVNVAAPQEFQTVTLLPFVPVQSHYSRGLDKLVMAANNPNAIKIYDMASGSIQTVELPLAVKDMSLSANGKLAAVLHEGIASMIDLEKGTLLKSYATGGKQSAIFVTDAGVHYLIGASPGTFGRPSVMYFDGYTGLDLILPEAQSMGSFYGVQHGILAPSLNKVFLMSEGLSPGDIEYFSFNPSSNGVTAIGDSPYHGDHNMSTPFYLTTNQNYLFTSYGTYFSTSDLKYVGKLSYTGYMHSLSNSPDGNEVLVSTASNSDWYWGAIEYSSKYSRFTGSLLLPDGEYEFPQIEGQVSYGIAIFHSGNGRRVSLVQTGTSVKRGEGARYYVVAH